MKVIRLHWVILDLLSQLPNINPQIFSLISIFHPPNVLQDRTVGKGFPCIFHKIDKQIELCGSQVNDMSLDFDLVFLHIHINIPTHDSFSV